jgi:thiol-disulfide isomerase/thioredoxin
LLASPLVWAGDHELISQGREVDIERHLVPGKYVLFDFFAPWCAPCRIIKPHIGALADRLPDTLAVREVDVIDWDSPVARQYGISVLPFLKLYGPTGEMLAEGDAERVLTELERRIGAAGVAPPRDPNPKRSPVAWVVGIGLIVAAVVVVRRLTRIGRGIAGAGEEAPPEAAQDLDSPEVWFAVIDGSLDGPFSAERLAGLEREKRIDRSSRVRRRGDASWRTAADVLDELD